MKAFTRKSLARKAAAAFMLIPLVAPLAGCGNAHLATTAQVNTNVYGPTPGTGISPNGAALRTTGPLISFGGAECLIPRSVREIHYNAAGQFIRNIEVRSELVSGQCGTQAPARGICLTEQPVTREVFQNGVFQGRIIEGIRMRRTPCPPWGVPVGFR